MDMIGKTFVSYELLLAEKRTEHLAIGNRSCGNNAPRPIRRVVTNGLTTKSCKSRVRPTPPPPHPPPQP